MSKLSFSWRRFGAMWNALELNKCSLLMNEIDSEDICNDHNSGGLHNITI